VQRDLCLFNNSDFLSRSRQTQTQTQKVEVSDGQTDSGNYG